MQTNTFQQSLSGASVLRSGGEKVDDSLWPESRRRTWVEMEKEDLASGGRGGYHMTRAKCHGS